MSDDANKAEDEGSGTSYRRMTDAQFAEARELYELGKMGLADLADTYSISRQALNKRFKAAGAKKGSRAHEVAAAAGAAAKAASSASTAAAAEKYADKRADWIEETRLEGISALKQTRMMARKIVLDAMRAAGATPGAGVLAAVDDDLKTVQRLNKILIDNLTTSLDILRANEHVDEDSLPTLIIDDLTDQEILDHHKSTGALPEDATLEDMLAEEIEVPA